jgi:predicted amidohydrolase
MMYGAPVIMANRTGAERDLTFWGGSRIVDPFGRELAVAGKDEGLITADLKFDEVRRARHLLPTVRDSNIGLVHRETTRLIEVIGVPDIVRAI